MIGAAGKGVVLASYGRGVLVQPDPAPGAPPPSGVPHLRCSLKGRNQRIVCGDRITWVYEPANDGASVEAIEPRRNLVERIDLRGRAEPVAANIDRLAIVVAPEPAADWFLVDRYWAGARLKDIASWLIVNKSDLRQGAIQQEIENYRGLGLPCLETTVQSAEGVERLRSAWLGGVTLLVGQSGVGKSSIVNALAPDAAAQTAELTRDAEGRHTTTTARRYSLGPDTAIVDAPGVRDFAPPASLQRAAERGFVEIHTQSVECRFKDCRHLEEPACAVRAAVTGGRISARRYESYRRLFRLYEKLAAP
ncbi:MAG TPA: ribosome small subunit-dependent GTPase A [Steroidobacteraceae bacterium]|nr:ribosome small subunit-dependent GTPase A [Steroidobacteraceae bacterium]